MGPIRLLRFVQVALVVFVGAGVAAWTMLRPPAETAGRPMLEAVDRVGQIRRVTIELVEAVQQLAELGPATSLENLTRARTLVELLDAAAGRLIVELKGYESAWVQVAEAMVILEDGQKLAKTALGVSPKTPIPEKLAARADPLETNPEKVGLLSDSAQGLKADGDQLISSTDALQLRVQQAVSSASFSRGTLLGFSSADLLVGLLVLAAFSALIAIRGASGWMTVPPAQAAKNELRRMAVTDPQGAMKECHDRVRELLEMADGFCRGERA